MTLGRLCPSARPSPSSAAPNMTTVGQAATAEIVSGAAAAPGWLARAIGLGAVALALLSAFATFVVLANLTPIQPNNEVVVTLLLANAVTVFFLVATMA